MSPQTRRFLVTMVVVAIAGAIVLLTFNNGNKPGATPTTPLGAPSSSPTSPTPPSSPSSPTSPSSPSSSGAADAQAPAPAAPGAQAPAQPPAGPAAPAATAPKPTPGGYSATYGARIPGGGAPPAAGSFTPMGSLDPAQARYRLRFDPVGAGISDVVFSAFWKNAAERRAFQAHDDAVQHGNPSPPPLPADSDRYVLQTSQSLGLLQVPLLAALEINIDNERIWLLDKVWAEKSPGVFATEIVDKASGNVVAMVERRFEVVPGAADGFGAGFELTFTQKIENLSGREQSVKIAMAGPGDLAGDPTAFGEVRRFHFGYLHSPKRDPSRTRVITHEATEDRNAVLSRVDHDVSVGVNTVLWPTQVEKDAEYELSWFGSTNRYFTLAVHAPYAPPQQTSKSLAGAISTVQAFAGPGDTQTRSVVTTLWSPEQRVAPSASAAFSMGIYPGPLDPRVLDVVEPYLGLSMDGLILYQMSGGCCSWCTFPWLASIIYNLLVVLHHYVVFDWALAIIVLVVIVRTLLHPITKRSQVQMQRFSRAMQAIKPELDALAKRYGDDRARMQQEQMRLYQEKGVSPVGCVGGILPTFLQMPIWIALYAVLYFAFALRQQPAFFGIFQNFGGWGFLGDLSSPDGFLPFGKTFSLVVITISGINLIPILMGVVFYVSQKYMTPPPTTTLTPDQQRQQNLMKWMMVILFPLGLYNAPAGLTLYILTSTCVGIFEGRAIRRQIETMDLSPKPVAKKPQDRMGRMYAEALARARERQKGPPKKYKERG